jgi:hypothetical protein
MATSVEGSKPVIKVFVATTVMLTFISFWRASAIVLSDLASSAYYAGGDAEKVIGKSAPWFILAVMLFSYAVRALYIESSSMFVRGGVYRVVKEAMGGTLAKFSVSALLFRLRADRAHQRGFRRAIPGGIHQRHGLVLTPAALFPTTTSPPGWQSSSCLFLVEEYAGHARIQPEGVADHGHHHGDGGDSADLVHDHGLARADQLPPNPLHAGVVPLNKESLGWLTLMVQAPPVRRSPLDHCIRRLRPLRAGHERRRDSGPGQPRNRTSQAEEPGKDRAGDFHLQPAVHFAGFVLRGDDYSRQGASGLFRQPHRRHRVYLAGPESLKLLFHGFVVLVGVLILAGAQNTSIVGANGVLNRVAEDGVLTSWFQKPHTASAPATASST